MTEDATTGVTDTDALTHANESSERHPWPEGADEQGPDEDVSDEDAPPRCPETVDRDTAFNELRVRAFPFVSSAVLLLCGTTIWSDVFAFTQFEEAWGSIASAAVVACGAGLLNLWWVAYHQSLSPPGARLVTIVGRVQVGLGLGMMFAASARVWVLAFA